MGGGALGSDCVSKLGSKEVSKNSILSLRGSETTVALYQYPASYGSQVRLRCKSISLNINEITTQSPIARNDNDGHLERSERSLCNEILRLTPQNDETFGEGSKVKIAQLVRDDMSIQVSDNETEKLDCHVAGAPRNDIKPTHPNLVLDLLHAHRVSLFALTCIPLNLFAIRTRFALSVRKSAPLKREGTLIAPKSHKVAFTLAEVLITLGIIGVVAALTIPSLVENYQKKEAATRLKYAYSVLAQAILLSEKDNGPESEWEVDKSEQSEVKITENFVKTYVEPYLKTIKEDKYTNSSSKYDYYYRKDGKLEKVGGNTLYSIALSNGIYLHFNANFGISDDIDIRVDTNGIKGPNVVGRDTFQIKFYPKLSTRADYINDRNTLLRLCNYPRLNEQLTICPALIQHDGWQISDDYPW